jgi:hypothetical protein
MYIVASNYKIGFWKLQKYSELYIICDSLDRSFKTLTNVDFSSFKHFQQQLSHPGGAQVAEDIFLSFTSETIFSPS